MPSKAINEGKARAVEMLKQLNEDLPLAQGYPEVPFNREQAFILYASFSGDIEKTAYALGADPGDVIKTAEAGKWQERLSAIFKLKKINRPGDVERAINRATNFAQASRMRLFLEKLVHKFYTMSDEDVERFCFSAVKTTDKDGNVTVEHKLNTRPFADFASALEKVQVLTYLALTDTTTERGKRKMDEDDGKTSAEEIHSAIAAAVAKAAGDQSPRAALYVEQQAQVQNIMEEGAKLDPDTPLKPPGV